MSGQAMCACHCMPNLTVHRLILRKWCTTDGLCKDILQSISVTQPFRFLSRHLPQEQPLLPGLVQAKLRPPAQQLEARVRVLAARHCWQSPWLRPAVS